MMKKSYIFSIVSIVLLAFFTVQTASAQTMKVFTGQVGYAYKAANVGEMTFANGTTLTTPPWADAVMYFAMFPATMTLDVVPL